MSTLRAASRMLRVYGLGHVAGDLDRAVEEIVGQLRTGQGVAREVSAAVADRERAWRDRQVSLQLRNNVADELYLEMIEADDIPDMRPSSSDRRTWIWEFIDSLDAGALEVPVSVLLPAARRFIETESARLVAGGCTCGHWRPHPPDTGCLVRRCGCMSPRRARSLATALANVQNTTEDDLRAAWPRLAD